MKGKDKDSVVSMRTLPAMAVGVMLCLMLWACGEKEKETLKGNFNPETFPTMTTTNVSTLISDSGVLRYKIESPIWLIYDQAKEPYWNFPKGLHLEKYNDMFRIEAEVRCDSARFFKDKQLWRLDGYVEVTNIAGEKFLTPQLFWDQRKQKLYSDSFIHIERQGRIIEGYGFESNERMSKYEVRKVMGMFPAQDFKPGEGAPDSAGAGPRPLPATPAIAAPGLDSANYAVEPK